MLMVSFKANFLFKDNKVLFLLYGLWCFGLFGCDDFGSSSGSLTVQSRMFLLWWWVFYLLFPLFSRVLLFQVCPRLFILWFSRVRIWFGLVIDLWLTRFLFVLFLLGLVLSWWVRDGDSPELIRDLAVFTPSWESLYASAIKLPTGCSYHCVTRFGLVVRR